MDHFTSTPEIHREDANGNGHDVDSEPSESEYPVLGYWKIRGVSCYKAFTPE